MYRSTLFVVGLLGTLGMLSFIVGVWNGSNANASRNPDVLCYNNSNEMQNGDIRYEIPNSESRGTRTCLISLFVRN